MIAALVTIATLVVHLIFLGRFLYRVVWLGLDFVEDDDDESENATTDDSLEETKDEHLALVISHLINTTIENSNSALKEHMDLQTTRMNDICSQLSTLNTKTAKLQPIERRSEQTAPFDIASLIDHKLDSFNSALQKHASLQTTRIDDICRQLSALEAKSSMSQQAKQCIENDEHDVRNLGVADIDDVQKANTQDTAKNKGIEDIMSKLSALEEKFYTLRQEELSHSKDQVADLLVAHDKTLAVTIREHEQKNAVALKTLEADKDALLAKKDHQLQITMYLLRQEAAALEQARFEYTKLDVFQTAEHTTTAECATETVECATKTIQCSTATADCATQTPADFVVAKLSNELSQARGVIDQYENLFKGFNAEVNTFKKNLKEAGEILIEELVPRHQESYALFDLYLKDLLDTPLMTRKIIWCPEDAPPKREFAQDIEPKIKEWTEEGEDEIFGKKAGEETESSVDEEARSPSMSSESGSETFARSDASSYTSPASSDGGDLEKANESERPESPIPYRPTSPDYHFTEATASSSRTSYGEDLDLNYDYGTGASYEDQAPYARPESPPFDPEVDPNAMDEDEDLPYRPTSPDYCYAASPAPEDSTSDDESSKLDERPESPMSCRPSSPTYEAAPPAPEDSTSHGESASNLDERPESPMLYTPSSPEPAPTAPADSPSSSPTTTLSDEQFGARTSDEHPSTFSSTSPSVEVPSSGRTDEDSTESSNLDERPESPIPSSPAYEPAPTAPEDSASSSPAATTSSDERRTSDSAFAFTPTPSSHPPPSTPPLTPEGLSSRPAFVPPTTYPSDWWQTPGASTSTLPTPPPFSAPPQPRTRDPRPRPRHQGRPVRDLPKRRGKEKEKEQA